MYEIFITIYQNMIFQSIGDQFQHIGRCLGLFGAYIVCFLQFRKKFIIRRNLNRYLPATRLAIDGGMYVDGTSFSGRTRA
jgi:hypothetical protein